MNQLILFLRKLLYIKSVHRFNKNKEELPSSSRDVSSPESFSKIKNKLFFNFEHVLFSNDLYAIAWAFIPFCLFLVLFVIMAHFIPFLLSGLICGFWLYKCFEEDFNNILNSIKNKFKTLKQELKNLDNELQK